MRTLKNQMDQKAEGKQREAMMDTRRWSNRGRCWMCYEKDPVSKAFAIFGMRTDETQSLSFRIVGKCMVPQRKALVPMELHTTT